MKITINIVCVIMVFAIFLPEAVYAKKCSISLKNCDLIACATGEGTCTVPEMNDFCIVPPFIQEIAKPNLLMIIDNSASMYDLQYVDKGKKHCSVSTGTSCFLDSDCPKHCSVTTATACTIDSNCPSGQTCVLTQTCSVFDRDPFYCFDQTYNSATTYLGYFRRLQADDVSVQYYNYNFAVDEADKKFDAVNSFACSEAAGQTKKSINNELCIIYDTARNPTDQVVKFLASGNYLNWLTASKFDVEKKILTGGRYFSTSGTLNGESRGCVGQGYIKDALTGNFRNYDNGAYDTSGNTQLGVSFRVKGPPNAFNPVSPSVGGPTYLDIWASAAKSYDFQTCQTAISDIATGDNAEIKKSVDDCLQNTTPAIGSCTVNGQACVTSFLDPANPATTTPNCDNPVVPQHCQNGDPNKLCNDAIYSGGNCIISGAKQCTNLLSRTCVADSNCDVKVCSLNNAASCSSDANCAAVPEVMGTCSKGSGTCRVANDCANKTALCSGYVAPVASKGTCVVSSSGTCQSGDVNQGPCVVQTGGYVGPCILPAGAAVVKTKVAFQQNMQECWKIRGTVQTAPMYGFTNMNTIKNQCPDIFASYKGCSNNTQKQCTLDADCGAGNTCLSGPAAIGPGNPALLCGNQFAGAYYQQTSPFALLGTDSELAAVQYLFCQSINSPNVTDPTDSPANSASTSSIPAILSGLAIESQLGQPISQNLRVRTAVPSAPSGLVQEYGSKIRMGVMKFNDFGSAYEVTNIASLAAATDLNRVTATKTCSAASGAASGTRCLTEFDCGGSAATAYCTVAANQDGAQIVALIGKGHCSATIATACTKQAHCPSGETCVSDGVGDHSTGLVSSIDGLRAASWTPFSEAVYNAIGYFAIDPTDATKKTSRTDLRLNATDFPDAMNPSEYVCQANNILLITDGGSTADLNSSVTGLVDTYKSVSGNVTGACGYFQGSQNLDDLSWLARQRNINTFSKSSASTTKPVKKNESITTYVVLNGPDNGQAGECNNVTLLNQAANKGGTALLKTDLPEQYENTLRTAFAAVAGGTASGTAASILSNSEGSGANILQAVFYPSKEFETESGQTTPTSASWIGEMQNLWYYVDPFIGNSSVREDSNVDKALHVVNDYVTEFQFKGGETIAVLKKDANGDGSGDSVVTTAMDARVKSQGYCSTTTDTKCATDSGCPAGETCTIQGIVNADDVNSLWRAGKQLWNRDLSSSPRKLYTYLYGSSAAACGATTFSVTGLYDLAAINWNTIGANDKCIIKAYLQAADDTEAINIIKFVQGYDHSDYDLSAGKITSTIGGNKPRNRSVQIGGTKKVWKLGDIIASTPRIQSFNKLNNFHLDSPAGYGDMTYADDATGRGYANSAAYKARGMAYAGANDGMLHAFKLGSLSIIGSGQTKATLGGSGLGEEQWAFIPQNVLPYLKYLTDPSYSHLYLVDGPTRLLDASIGYNNNAYISSAASRAVYATAGCDAGGSGSHTAYWACKQDSTTDNNQSWRTILIGSMGIGGASAEFGAACTNCVKNPVAGVGNSSYFALDITDPANPRYLWEFSHAELGYATTGAAVARVAHKFTNGGITYKDTNGRWFAVVGSGPTGPIDTTYHQFKGKSDNPLHVFVLDLKTGALLRKFDTTINNAFAGSMVSAPIDTDRSRKLDSGFYSDEALYFGYSNCTANCDTDTPTWNGGIMRLLTDENIAPDNWALSTLISNVGPVSTAVGKLQDRKNRNLWLYTGSGRYFFKGDDSTVPGKILAVKEPCYDKTNDDIYTIGTINGQASKCTNEIEFASGEFANQTTAINSMDNKKGWFIDLEGADNVNSFGAERIITEPVAMPNGAVFFTSFMPSTDICNYGGKSFMWGMSYDNGGTASSNKLKGKALVQVSTGSFEEINLSTALSGNLGRKMSSPMIGKPPTDPPPIVSASGNRPLKRILHIQER